MTSSTVYTVITIISDRFTVEELKYKKQLLSTFTILLLDQDTTLSKRHKEKKEKRVKAMVGDS